MRRPLAGLANPEPPIENHAVQFEIIYCVSKQPEGCQLGYANSRERAIRISFSFRIVAFSSQSETR
jgi:hypothetical protein